MSGKSYSIAQLSELIGGEVHGDVGTTINGLAPITLANSNELTYLVGGKYVKHLESTNASIVILEKKHLEKCQKPAIIVENPEAAFATIAELFNPHTITAKPGVHPLAAIGEGCTIPESVTVSAGCVIGDGVVIGENTILQPGVIIGDNCRIGADCLFYPRATVYQNATIGDRTILHSGVVLGADGFGYAQDQGSFKKIPQIGCIKVGDDCEIGANTTIDRGALKDTIIGNGVKIDNLVQIGHNCIIGDHSVIAGCVGIAGSVTLGRYCMLGGASVISGHISLCDQTIVTGFSSVGRDITEPGVYSSGFPAQPRRAWFRIVSALYELPGLLKTYKDMTKGDTDS